MCSWTRRGRIEITKTYFRTAVYSSNGVVPVNANGAALIRTDELAGQDTSGNALTVMVNVQVSVQLVPDQCQCR